MDAPLDPGRHGGEISGDGARVARHQLPWPGDELGADHQGREREREEHGLEVLAAAEPSAERRERQPRSRHAAIAQPQRRRARGERLLEPRTRQRRGVDDDGLVAAARARAGTRTKRVRVLAPERHRVRARLDREQRQPRRGEPAKREVRCSERQRRHGQELGERPEQPPALVLVEDELAGRGPDRALTCRPCACRAADACAGALAGPSWGAVPTSYRPPGRSCPPGTHRRTRSRPRAS